jgi:hypothetical protein
MAKKFSKKSAKGQIKVPAKNAKKKSTGLVEDSGIPGGDLVQGVGAAVFVEGPVSKYVTIGLNMWCPGLATALFGGEENTEVMDKLNEIQDGLSEIKDMVSAVQGTLYNLFNDSHFSKIYSIYSTVYTDFEIYKMDNSGTIVSTDSYIQWIKNGRVGRELHCIPEPLQTIETLSAAINALSRGILETRTVNGDLEFLSVLKRQLKNKSLYSAINYYNIILDEIYGCLVQASFIFEVIQAHTLIQKSIVFYDKRLVNALSIKNIGVICEFTSALNDNVSNVFGNLTQISNALKEGWYAFQIVSKTDSSKFLNFKLDTGGTAGTSDDYHKGIADPNRYRFRFLGEDKSGSTARTYLRSTELYGQIANVRDYKNFAIQLGNRDDNNHQIALVVYRDETDDIVSYNEADLTPISLAVINGNNEYKWLEKWDDGEFIRACDKEINDKQKWLLHVAVCSQFINNDLLFFKVYDTPYYLNYNITNKTFFAVLNNQTPGSSFRVIQDSTTRRFKLRIEYEFVTNKKSLFLAMDENGNISAVPDDGTNASIWFSVFESPKPYFGIWNNFSGRCLTISTNGKLVGTEVTTTFNHDWRNAQLVCEKI